MTRIRVTWTDGTEKTFDGYDTRSEVAGVWVTQQAYSENPKVFIPYANVRYIEFMAR